MLRTASVQQDMIDRVEPYLSSDQFVAMQEACGPVGFLSFPAPDIIRTLRKLGYVEIVLGGLQITPMGLERLLRERRSRGPTSAQP